ncbi:OmpA family protein [Hymenobacter ginkgonis]|nr:OmpA family protein [Hymenobacter ginkgonis]
MSLFATINQQLSDALLAQLASVSGATPPLVRSFWAAAVPVLVWRLSEPTTVDEVNARWDMCRQLFESQVLTDSEELLRTDLGWPARRHYLAEKILGAPQVDALVRESSSPAAAATLLGYLTIIALAVLGEKAYTDDLEPVALGNWLQQQSVPAASATQDITAEPALAAAGRSKATVLSVVGAVGLVGAAGLYFLLGTPANATQQQPSALAATKTARVPQPTEIEAPLTKAPVAAAPAPMVAAAKEASSATVAKALPPHSAAMGASLPDTVGNNLLATQIGGKFSVELGKYLRGEGQPLLLKLADRATLTVGINSTESLLYKRLANPRLPRPADIAIDRLSFDSGKARLGAEGAQQLGNVASLLKTFPKARLLVVGHATNMEPQAMVLGLQRATAAVDELVKQGVSASRLQAQGGLATGQSSPHDSAERQALLHGITLKISTL